MVEPKYPKGWDENRVQNLINQYEEMTEDELVAEDEAGCEITPE